LWLVISVWLLIPPKPALWGLVSLPFSLAALGWLLAHRHQSQHLKPALGLTVAATLLHGLGMAWGFAQMAYLR
jgi:1,4-dihydroxy-2-naphthoate octaprenyltransferase